MFPRYLMIAISLCLPGICRADIHEGSIRFVGGVYEGTCALAEPKHDAPPGNLSEGKSAGTTPLVPISLYFESCTEKLASGLYVSIHYASEENKGSGLIFSGGKRIASSKPVDPAEFIRKNNQETSLKLLFSYLAAEGKGQPGAVVHLRYD